MAFSRSSDRVSARFNGLVRLSRAIYTIASNVIDYKYSLHGLLETSDEYKRILLEPELPCRALKEGVEIDHFWELLGGKIVWQAEDYKGF